MRIVLGYVVLLAAALAIAIVVTRQVLHARLDARVDRELAQEVEEFRLLAAGTDPATGEPFGLDVAAMFETYLSRSVPSDHEAFYTLVAGRPFLYSFDAPPELLDDGALVTRWASTRSPVLATETTVAGETRMLIVPLAADGDILGTFVVAYLLADERAEIGQSIRVITVASLVVLAISAAVAWSLAGQVLQPVRQLTTTAREVTDADLSARIPVEGHDELAELGQTFNEMLDRLERGVRRQRQFLDDVAHELRTPITIARGHLEIMGDDPAERTEAAEVVIDELDRMGRYVSDLLLIAKAEAPDFVRPGPVDLGELAGSLLQRVGAIPDRTWVLDEAPPLGRLAVLADEERLTQAVLNLATNAVQHTRTGDEIAIGVAAEGADVRIWVRDTGEGVDADVAGDLFVRERRGERSRTLRPEGMGIGLSIVDAIARAHGGSVTVESRAGHGATFTIEFPVDDSDANSSEETR